MKLVAPVLGENVVVCRNGDQVWAIPGQKIEFLLGKFRIGPTPTRKNATPLFIPLTAQQAVFLPALFVLEEGGFETVDGEECRVLTGGMMPELAKVMKADDFKAKMWVGSGYIPRKIQIARDDFTMTVAVKKAEFTKSLPPETWQPPEGVTDVYRCSPEYLERVLYVVMNSLQMDPEDSPWEIAK